MSDALITILKALKLFGMADTIANLAEQASRSTNRPYRCWKRCSRRSG